MPQSSIPRSVNKGLRQSEAGFALPLVMTVGIIVAGIVLGTLKVAIDNSANSRVRFLSSLGNSVLESFANEYRSLLNDSSFGNLFNQFWLVQGCGFNTPASTCPKDSATGNLIAASGIQSPERSYWGDNSGFCDDFPRLGAKGCIGRQISPTCDYSNPNSPGLSGGYIDWSTQRRMIDSVFSAQRDLSRSQTLGNGISAYGTVGKYVTIGQIEKGGRSHLDISGLIKEGNNLKAERRARVSMEVERATPYSGFAYIAAGYQQSDTDAIHLSNLRVYDQNYNGTGNTGRGTILLRRNMSNWDSSLLDPAGCNSHRDIFFFSNSRASSSSLPTRGNGGLLLHSPYWPTSAKLGTAPSTRPNSQIVNTVGTTNCLRSNGSPERIYEYNNLFILRGATLCIETSDQSKALLRIADSLHVAPGAKLCHIAAGSSVCGSGKPANLTIVSTFRDYSTGKKPVSADSGCSNNRGGEGLGESYSSRSLTGSPGPSFTFQGTGSRSRNERLSAFIYGTDLAFNSSGVHRGRTGTYLSNDLDTNYGRFSGALVIHRSRLAATRLNGTSDTSVWGLVNPNGRFVIQGDASRSSLNGMNDRETGYLARKSIVAIADRTDYGSWYGVAPSIYIAYDWTRNRFEVNTFRRLNSISSGGTNGLIQLETLVNRDIYTPWGYITRYFYPWQLGQYYSRLKLFYGISISAPTSEDVNPIRAYTGAVWARRVCFSRNWAYGDFLQSHHWVFDPKFVDGLVDRYGEDFRWGLSNYKSRFVKSWDILRDFFN